MPLNAQGFVLKGNPLTWDPKGRCPEPAGTSIGPTETLFPLPSSLGKPPAQPLVVWN